MPYLIATGVFLLLLLVLANKGSRKSLFLIVAAGGLLLAWPTIKRELDFIPSNFGQGTASVFLLALAGILYLILKGYRQQGEANKTEAARQQHVAQLRRHYEAAIADRNKMQVLKAGRAYYAALRGNGTLTSADEQAIANDLNAIS